MSPLRGSSLTHSILEYLGAAIVTEQFSPSNPLPSVAELCKQYGVCRSTVREAIMMLTAKGLLGATSGLGIWVQAEDEWCLFDPDVLRWMLKRRLSLSLLVELNQTRLAVEPIAARLAALQRNGAKKAAVASAIARMAAADCESDDPLASDIAFHVAIMRATDNRFYAQLCDLIETALRSSIRTTNQANGDRLASVANHRKVSDAIMEGDASKAESTMRYLIQESPDLIRTAAAGAISFAQPPNAVSVRMAITQDRALELLPGSAP